MRRTFYAPLFLLLLVVFNSCQKQLDDSTVLSDSNDQTFSLTDDDCGTAMTKDLVDMGGSPLSTGTVVIGNDADKISIRVHAAGEGITVKKIIAVYGSHDHVKNAITETVLWTPCQGPLNPDRVKNSDPGLVSDSIHLPLSSFQQDGCVWIGLYVTLTNAAGFEWCTFPSPFDEAIPGVSIWKTFFKYCRQECEDEEEDDCGPLRTQTQGGWGSKPSGNNNGAYLHENFADAFPDGLTVGCEDKYTVKFTSADAITEFLPAGGEPGKLKASAVDPADKSIKNVLIGQLTALTLNIGFDEFDDDFGEAGKKLADMFIKKGKFQGKTVAEFLEIANKVLGGCSTEYKASYINEIATKINENYVDGKCDKGFLVCEIDECGCDDDDDHGDGDDDDDDDDDDDEDCDNN